MAVMHGKNANIIWDAPAGESDIVITYAQNWTLDVTHDVSTITAFQDTWKTYLTGFQNWTATAESLEETTGPEIVIGGDDGMGDDECRLELYFLYDTGTPLYKVMYGNAICTGISEAANTDGIPTLTYSFQGVAQMQWASGAARPA